MTSKVEEILAETWDESDLVVHCHEESLANLDTFGPNEKQQLRAALAVLGQQTLRAFLKRFPRPERDCPLCFGWLNGDGVNYGMQGNQCKPGCEWGRIVAEAKALG